MELYSYQVLAIVGFSVLMVVSAVGNSAVLYRLARRKKAGKASRLDKLLIHLAVADLLVTFLMIPVLLALMVTRQWLAGAVMCRVMMFASVFGLYLSSFVVTCIAVDRYYAIVKPLNVSWEARLRRVLYGAWGCAALASLPDFFVYDVVEENGDTLCNTYDPLTFQWRAYYLFNIVLVYMLPLAATVYCSAAAIREIVKRTKTGNDGMRRSGVGVLGRARVRTLKMTVTIVAVFIICWTPYYCFYVWSWLDPEFLFAADPLLLCTLNVFFCFNSCANPIVYGVFNRKRKHKVPTRVAAIAVVSHPRERIQPMTVAESEHSYL